jgi:hypothetical protein
MKAQPTQQRNLVAKHARAVCKAQTFVDRKKAVKRGFVKHKKLGISHS